MKRYFLANNDIAEIEITKEEYTMYKVADRDEFWMIWVRDEFNNTSEMVLCPSLRKLAQSITRVNSHENKD